MPNTSSPWSTRNSVLCLPFETRHGYAPPLFLLRLLAYLLTFILVHVQKELPAHTYSL